jgi:hypothetical protein
MIEHLAVKPPGRPSAKPKAFFHDFSYRVKSWKRPRFLPASGPWALFRYEVIGKIKGRSIE